MPQSRSSSLTSQPQLYTVSEAAEVGAILGALTPIERRVWQQVCRPILSENPKPHVGTRAYRLFDFPIAPMRTCVYEVTQEITTSSGAKYYLLSVDHFPAYMSLFLTNDSLLKVQVLSLLPNDRY